MTEREKRKMDFNGEKVNEFSDKKVLMNENK